ncbi:hypothetical protein [Qipengyuania sp. JC766]|uniref:hypothetical protein n=1 Tax=Qipengyuania sp. JC766 TaxID=3232139 RepID=UPI00345A0B82
MRDRLYRSGMSLVFVVFMGIIWLENPPWQWGAAEFGSLLRIAGVVFGLVLLLSLLDRFAKSHGMGEARFNQNGKVIDDD